MRRVIALVVCAAAWLVVPSGTATGSATELSPAGPPAVKQADSQVRTVPLVVAHYDSGLQPANVPSGYQEKCVAQVYYRWPEIHGYQAQNILYLRNGSKDYHELTPPYRDGDPNGSLGGDFALPAGMHQYMGTGIYSTTNGPPGVYEDCRDEAETYRATHSATAEVTYYRTEACTDAQDKVDKASDKVKAAKKAVNQATNQGDKAKAKAKLKKAKKKLKKAKDLVGQAC